jgi:hypothetical protein
MKPNQDAMVCWVDVAHASEMNNKTASPDPSSARSRTGYIITYAGCPMHWTSKMQAEISLLTTEAKYLAPSQSKMEVFPIIWALEEAKHLGIPVIRQNQKYILKFLKTMQVQ